MKWRVTRLLLMMRTLDSCAGVLLVIEYRRLWRAGGFDLQVISAALAFAIIMLVLAMAVSTLVETIHRLFGMRERGLYYMLGQLYDHVLRHYDNGQPTDPNIQAPATADLKKKAFQDRMSENRSPIAVTAPAGTARTSYPSLQGGPWSLLRWVGANWRGRGLSNLTAASFMERLGGHPLGEKIVEDAARAGVDQVADPVDAVLQDIAQKFTAYANEASVFFRTARPHAFGPGGSGVGVRTARQCNRNIQNLATRSRRSGSFHFPKRRFHQGVRDCESRRRNEDV
jgi:hypothetical protein